ncbi:MAG: hypothetical protein CM15mP78_09140 [Candidatus Poseidoniales archaeon]|nr:MAG: hypothetical protein CM15mP78_09140 [Candidatus Poseidoniales archaeon]
MRFFLRSSPYLGVSLGWIWALIMFMTANVGLNGAGVFYNALLPHMGDDSEMDAISNKAFAAGYLGGGLLLVVHLALVLGLPGQSGHPIRHGHVGPVVAWVRSNDVPPGA